MDNILNPLISIILPVKNEALYLEECLDSIVSQTEKNWELLACDDHSTDSTREILKAYANKHQNIHFYTNKGEGIIPALITAYDHAKGDFITRMDGDDIMPSQKLASLKEILNQNGKGFVATGKVKYFPEEEIADGFFTYQNWLNSLCMKQSHWDEIYKECVIPSPCWMVHKDDFDACGGFSASCYPEDYDLVFRMYQSGLKPIGSSQILHLWRDHPERTSRNSIHYQTQTFFELKLKYLFQVENLEDKNIVIWGAGKKGKVLAAHLRKMDRAFHWVCNNERKIGHQIEKNTLKHFRAIKEIENPYAIITVSGHEDRSEIIAFLEDNNLKLKESYLLFC